MRKSRPKLLGWRLDHSITKKHRDEHTELSSLSHKSILVLLGRAKGSLPKASQGLRLLWPFSSDMQVYHNRVISYSKSAASTPAIIKAFQASWNNREKFYFNTCFTFLKTTLPKSHTILWFISHWPESSHMTPHSWQGDWEISQNWRSVDILLLRK